MQKTKSQLLVALSMSATVLIGGVCANAQPAYANAIAARKSFAPLAAAATNTGYWKKIGSRWRYITGAGGLFARNCWMTIGGKRYHFDSAGWMQTGWIKLSGKWYYLDSSGAMVKSKWISNGGKWYYLGADGVMLTNTTTPDGYKVNASGAWVAKTSSSSKPTYREGWVKSGSRWWYRYKDGSYPRSTIVKISGKSYGFDSSGWMVTGWKKFNGSWYYFNSSGAMAKDCWIQGKYYVGTNGVMLTNCWTPDGYWVGGDGAWVKSKGRRSSQWFVGTWKGEQADSFYGYSEEIELDVYADGTAHLFRLDENGNRRGLGMNWPCRWEKQGSGILVGQNNGAASYLMTSTGTNSALLKEADGGYSYNLTRK